MSAKDKSKDKDKFENIAKELECDESDDALNRAVEGLSLETEKDKKEEPEAE